MDKIAEDFKDEGIVFYQIYTREPHAGQKMAIYNFSDKKQTETNLERVDYALEMIKEYFYHYEVMNNDVTITLGCNIGFKVHNCHDENNLVCPII